MFHKFRVRHNLRVLENGMNEMTKREKAATTLGRLGDAKACPLLIRALTNDSWPQAEAAAALGMIADRQAVEPLIEVLGERTSVRPAAANALALMGETKWKEWIKGDGNDLNRLAAHGDASAVPALIRALSLDDWKAVEAAIIGLSRLGDRRAVKPLLLLIRSSEALKDQYLHTILREIMMSNVPEKFWGPSLHVRLSLEQSSNVHSIAGQAVLVVQTAAIKALGQLGDKEAIEVLKTFENHEDADLREAAIQAVSVLEAPSSQLKDSRRLG